MLHVHVARFDRRTGICSGHASVVRWWGGGVGDDGGRDAALLEEAAEVVSVAVPNLAAVVDVDTASV